MVYHCLDAAQNSLPVKNDRVFQKQTNGVLQQNYAKDDIVTVISADHHTDTYYKSLVEG